MTSYQYQLRNAQTRLDAINENIATNQDILKNYKNDEIFVSMQESDAAKTTKTTTDYYNRLIIEQANNYDKVAQLETQISDLMKKLARLNESADSDTNAADLEAAARELSATMDLCRKTYDQICAQLTEIFDSSFFTVGGEAVSSYKADVDTDPAYTGDTEVVLDGYFHESEFRSAPYFDLQIDGIDLLDVAF